MFRRYLIMATVTFGTSFCAAPVRAGVPVDVLRQLPPAQTILTSATSAIGRNHKYYFVALASQKESKSVAHETRSPARPLLIFERRASGRYALVGRNDSVILHADDGGINGCDPFETGKIEVKGRYFTVEQGVACGAHWTDYVTFRFDPRSRGFVFDNWRVESWSVNRSNDSNAEALVSDGVKIVRAKSRPVPFSKWRRPRTAAATVETKRVH